MKNTAKTAHCRPTKHRIAQFSLIVGRRNGKSSPKQRFVPLRRAENSENCVSGHPDGRKLGKTAFRGTPTSRNWRKQRFGAPRRAEIGKNRFSGHPDEQKLAKTAFRGTPTSKNCSDTGVNHRLAPSVARFFPRIKKNSLGKRHLGYRFSENYINFVLHLSLRLRLLRGSSSKAATEFRQNAFLQR